MGCRKSVTTIHKNPGSPCYLSEYLCVDNGEGEDGEDEGQENRGAPKHHTQHVQPTLQKYQLSVFERAGEREITRCTKFGGIAVTLFATRTFIFEIFLMKHF